MPKRITESAPLRRYSGSYRHHGISTPAPSMLLFFMSLRALLACSREYRSMWARTGIPAAGFKNSTPSWKVAFAALLHPDHQVSASAEANQTRGFPRLEDPTCEVIDNRQFLHSDGATCSFCIRCRMAFNRPPFRKTVFLVWLAGCLC